MKLKTLEECIQPIETTINQFNEFKNSREKNALHLHQVEWEHLYGIFNELCNPNETSGIIVSKNRNQDVYTSSTTQKLKAKLKGWFVDLERPLSSNKKKIEESEKRRLVILKTLKKTNLTKDDLDRIKQKLDMLETDLNVTKSFLNELAPMCNLAKSLLVIL